MFYCFFFCFWFWLEKLYPTRTREPHKEEKRIIRGNWVVILYRVVLQLSLSCICNIICTIFLIVGLSKHVNFIFIRKIIQINNKITFLYYICQYFLPDHLLFMGQFLHTTYGYFLLILSQTGFSRKLVFNSYTSGSTKESVTHNPLESNCLAMFSY